jgi:hypothetical protein
VPPLIAGTLQEVYGSTSIGLMLAAVASTSLVCIYLLPETNGTRLQAEQRLERFDVPMTQPSRSKLQLPGTGRWLSRSVQTGAAASVRQRPAAGAAIRRVDQTH